MRIVWLWLLGSAGLVCTAEQKKAPSPGEVSTSPPAVRSSWHTFRTEHFPSHREKRWIVIAHRPTRSLIDSLLVLGGRIVCIYAPEHGLSGEKAAGMTVGDTVYRDIPVLSLYGERRAPSPEAIASADAVLFALRDVGVRYYTYLSTLAYVLQAAARAQRPVWVLDFPNPHAHYTYGPVLESAHFSFIGLHPVPLVPGLTIGEYARMLVAERWVPAAELHVVPWTGWKRGDPLPGEAPFFTEPPSPALRTATAIELYPILGWYEGTVPISVGRGTEHPFEQVGILKKYPLPFQDTVIAGYRLDRVEFQAQGDARPYHGWRIKRLYPGPVTPDSLFRLGFFLLRTFRQATGFADGFYRADFFDRLFGSAELRRMERDDIETLYRRFRVPSEWQARRDRYTLYP